eukprot:CAMPEP_0181182918 /NCGR_PEP_ID=MMETSP1096-20121128/8142_1 /TAXON_ID=156174 ORGANISM="Chrysochromulina ericina, Strain CCMP281" /NCGR_SAMPLE_ID=MMETSP1096 /ASSEMBLY_ACC=CAM_ASM_000453 /LENGTH=38 /DNA_ID= /DNA_START= /DNA_END= /DNA_ORIENTATION=
MGGTLSSRNRARATPGSANKRDGQSKQGSCGDGASIQE